jgi:valacyclovir hydrolase
MPHFTHHGRHLFYREQGSGNLLLILTGNTASSACHASELDYFSRRFHVVALDFYGTGQSERAADWGSDWWQQGAHDASALIAHLNEGVAIVMGMSGGAMVSLLLAAAYPDRLQAVIADSCVAAMSPDDLRSVVAGRQAETPDQAAFWRFAQGDDWQQVVHADSAFLLRMAEQGGFSLAERLPLVRCPVLFTGSLRDATVVDPGPKICAMSMMTPGSRVFLSSEGEHPLMWSRRSDFRRAADCFLASLT